MDENNILSVANDHRTPLLTESCSHFPALRVHSHSHLMSCEQLVQPVSVQTAVMLVSPSATLRPGLQTNLSDEPSVPVPLSTVEAMVGWLPFGGFEHTDSATRGVVVRGAWEGVRQLEKWKTVYVLILP